MILETEQLANTYYAQRHGQSEGNTEQKLVSIPAEGIARWGLTMEGFEQVAREARNIKLDNKPLVFIVSPFLRAVQTAQVSQSILGGYIVIDERLSERFFGDYDMGPDSNLGTIWRRDRKDANNTDHGVESPAAVQQRFIDLIHDIEQEYQGYNVILVSHGDTLQIGQTPFAGAEPSKHRDLEHLHNAVIRRLGGRN